MESSSYSLHLLEDHKSEMYVKFAKVMIIFQGPNFENRKNLVEGLRSKFKTCSYFVSDETYKKETFSYFEEETENYHYYFRCRVKKACQEGNNLIVIDQSISNTSQIKYYMFLARAFQYVVLPFPPIVTERIPLEESKRKSPKDQASVFPRLESPNLFDHHFFGWFFHDIDSIELREEAFLYFEDCFKNIPEFEHLFQTQSCNLENFKNKYNMVDKRQDLAYCIVSFPMGEIDLNGYITSDDLKKNYGKVSKLHIVGFVLSNHTISARVKLTFQQRKLWSLDDHTPNPHQRRAYKSDILERSKIYMPAERIRLIGSKNNLTVEKGSTIYEPLKSIPPSGIGRCCHILLGKTDDASKHSIDYDASDALLREDKVVQEYPNKILPYDLTRCVARRIGKYWFIYLKETIVVSGFFSTFCTAAENVV